MKARKPGPFKIDCVDVAWCDVIDDDGCGRFVATQRVYMSASDAKRFAAWLTKAAAWCREGGR